MTEVGAVCQPPVKNPFYAFDDNGELVAVRGIDPIHLV